MHSMQKNCIRMNNDAARVQLYGVFLYANRARGANGALKGNSRLSIVQHRSVI